MNNDRKLLEQALNLLESEWPEGDEIAQPVIDAIREVLAEPEITTPDVCGEVCARAKLCYGCGKAFDEALADHVEQNLTMVADHSGDANEMVAEPVKQEPVAWHNPECEGECLACLIERCVKDSYGKIGLDYMLRHVNSESVDAKAIRAEALEEAAKVCEEQSRERGVAKYPFWNDCAVAIRGLK